LVIIELHDALKPGCAKTVFEAFSKYNFSFSPLGENVVFTNLNMQ
jgi:hypothetical protein